MDEHIKNKLKEQTDFINMHLDKYLKVNNNAQKTIYEAMRYSVFAGGKRLRPILMMNVCEMCGGSKEQVIPFACAMEMIHTYSLIHDDLPAMDNDDLRRGMPTNHIKFGEATAILAGDALLNKAFEIVSDSENESSSLTLKAINILAVSSGTEGMIGGQVVDMISEGKNITIEELEYLQMNKTGAIIRSACVIGAVIAGADEEKIQAVDTFAKNLGAAFQIRDDILDVIGSRSDSGKSVGSDDRDGKNTYVSIMGIEKADNAVETYSKKAKEALAPFGEKAKFLSELTDSLINRKK